MLIFSYAMIAWMITGVLIKCVWWFLKQWGIGDAFGHYSDLSVGDNLLVPTLSRWQDLP